jgi:hypothetical protein
MSAYRLVERNLYTNQPLRMWDAHNGHEMTASQATELLLHVAKSRPELHMAGAETFLEICPIADEVALVAAAVLWPDSPLLPVEAIA